MDGLADNAVAGGFKAVCSKMRHLWKLTPSATRFPTSKGVPLPLGGTFEYDSKRERLQEVDRELENPKVWDKPERAQELGRERARLHEVVTLLDKLSTGLNDSGELLEMLAEEGDEKALGDVSKDVDGMEQQVADMEFRRMFSGEMDSHNAFLDIQAGSGGTEAQDWAEMLLRMYLRWGERRGFKTELVEASAGEVAGIKSATIR